MQTDFVLDALEQALYARRHEREGALVHHGERGSQYVSIRYGERLSQAGIEPSVGSTGDSHDNALAETINRLFKAEIIHRRGPWKTREAVELATLEWVSWFNHHRLLKSIGYIPPAEDEANYWAATRPVRTTNPPRQMAHIAGGSNHEYMAQPGGLRRPLRGADGRKIQQPIAILTIRPARPDSSQQASSKAGAVQIQGAKSAVMTAHRRQDKISQWAVALRERSGWQEAVVALANKNARILWAVMTRGEAFDANHLSVKPAGA